MPSKQALQSNLNLFRNGGFRHSEPNVFSISPLFKHKFIALSYSENPLFTNISSFSESGNSLTIF